MTECKSPTKFVGLHLGEFKVSHLQGLRLEAHFMLMTDDGPRGRVTRDHNWSEKVLGLLQALGAAMEEDVLPEIFQLDQDAQAPQEEVSEEPPQF